MAKATHFGRAGEFYAMSELLLRGWNVAVPVVDIGDDVFVIDDNQKTTYRIQVKSANADLARSPGKLCAQYKIDREQLVRPRLVELFYMLQIRTPDAWRYLVIPRGALFEVRRRFEKSPTEVDQVDQAGKLNFWVTISGMQAQVWGQSLDDYLDKWPSDLPILP